MIEPTRRRKYFKKISLFLSDFVPRDLFEKFSSCLNEFSPVAPTRMLILCLNDLQRIASLLVLISSSYFDKVKLCELQKRREKEMLSYVQSCCEFAFDVRINRILINFFEAFKNLFQLWFESFIEWASRQFEHLFIRIDVLIKTFSKLYSLHAKANSWMSLKLCAIVENECKLILNTFENRYFHIAIISFINIQICVY